MSERFNPLHLGVRQMIALRLQLGNHNGMPNLTNSPTISLFLERTVAARRDERALGFIRNGELHWRTWQQVADHAHALAAALRHAGIEPGDRVAQVSENRYEWIVSDLALHLAGAVHVPVHITLSGEQIAAQIVDSGARLVFASTSELASKFASQIDSRIPIRIHDGNVAASNQSFVCPAASSSQPPVLCLATILYTSGTTGQPRGVMLSHANLATNAAATADAIRWGPDQTRLCILPLSHIYARTCDLYTWVYRGSRLVLAESRETLARDLQLAKPTSLSGVPYVFQKIADNIRNLPENDQTAAVCNFFGGRIETLSCGGAALAPDVEAWFAKHGMPILCGYGLTESSPVISLCTPTQHRRGSVGSPLQNVEVRIAKDGEIMARGPNIMIGYWREEAATAEVIRDGWLCTGDLGELDDGGFLHIRGRKKELIVLSTGKNVVPTRIENLLTASPLIEQAAIFGDRQSALVALIVPSSCGLARDTLAQEISQRLAGAAREEQIHAFAVLDRPFSIDRGELTPKLSLCREIIAGNFSAELEALRR